MSKRFFFAERVAVAALALILGFCLAPAVALLGHAASALTAENWRVLADGRHVELFLRSIFVAAVAALLALVWGVPTGLAASRLRGTSGAVFQSIAVLPLVLPSMVTVLGWIYFLGHNGFATRSLKWLFHLDEPPFDLYTPLGAGFVLSLIYFPCVSIPCAQAFRAMPPGTLKAALLAGSGWRRLRFVLVPLVLPHAALGASLVALLSLSDFAVPSALMVNVYPVSIHAQFSASLADGVSRSALLCLPPLLLALVLCFGRRLFLRRFSGRSEPSPTLYGGPGALSTSCPRSALALSLLALMLSVALPLVFLVVTAGPPSAYARAARTAGAQVIQSLIVASWATPILLVLGAAYAAATKVVRPSIRAWAESLVFLPLVIPGSVVGLGILALEGNGVPPWSWLYPHPAILACAAASRFLPFPALVLAQGWLPLRRRLLEAGEAAGVGPGRIFASIIVPILVPSILAAVALSFVLSLGELAAAVLVAPPGVMTLPVRLASLLHFGEEPTVAALCVMMSGFTVGVLALAQLLANQVLRLELHWERKSQ